MPRWLNLANLVTLGRLAMVPLIVGAIVRADHVRALELFFAAAVTDVIDGALARGPSGVTQFGAYLDPIADKCLMGGVYLALWASGTVPGWFVAIVFGRESSGLTNPELALCSIQSTIPAATDNHSLNLAQAVLIYCYALHRASIDRAPDAEEPAASRWKLAEHVELEHFYEHLTETLTRLRTKPATTMESYVARFRRVLSRIPLETRDVNLLHKLLAKVDEAAPMSTPAASSASPPLRKGGQGG